MELPRSAGSKDQEGTRAKINGVIKRKRRRVGWTEETTMGGIELEFVIEKSDLDLVYRS